MIECGLKKSSPIIYRTIIFFLYFEKQSHRVLSRLILVKMQFKCIFAGLSPSKLFAIDKLKTARPITV